MRLALLLALTALASSGCGLQSEKPAEDQPARAEPKVQAAEAEPETEPTAPSGANETAPSATPPDDPSLAGMSPYRRREYERGYRDCLSGNYDRERQGESYRIGCMAAENAKTQPGS